MADFTREKLSGSTNGLPIVVVATATPGTTIHTAVSGTTSWDEIYLWVNNTHTSAVTLTVEYGGTTDPDHLILDAVSIPIAWTPARICPGLILQNSLVVKAFASVASKLLISGFVNRIA